MYQEDRKLLLQQIQQTYGGGTHGGSSHPPPPPAPSSHFKPRPILIDKQFTSEPATPTGLGYSTSSEGRQQGMKPVIQRNLSDLSQRIKKRVTYRGLSLHDPPSRAQSAANFSSSLPAPSSLQSPQPSDVASPEELSSTTISETNRDDDSENLISLNDISSPLVPDMKSLTIDLKSELDRGGSPISCSSPPSTEESCFFSDSNSSCGLRGAQLPPATASSPHGKTLSTLNEQRSMESETGLPCLETADASSPQARPDPAVRRAASSDSLQHSPLTLRVTHLEPEQTHPLGSVTVSSSKTTRRPHRPILRLPSAPPTFPSGPQNSVMIGQPFDDSSSHPAAPPNSFASNHFESIGSLITQGEGCPKLCDKTSDVAKHGRTDSVPARTYNTSDL